MPEFSSLENRTSLRIWETFVVDRTLVARRSLPLVRHAKLMFFVAAMLVRTPKMRDHHARNWGEIRDMAEGFGLRMRDTSQEAKRRASKPLGSTEDSLTLDEVRALAENPMPKMLGPFIKAQVPRLLQMQSRILCTENDPGFITSDAPVVWFDPIWYKKPPMNRSPGLADSDLEITMPISPQQMLSITHGAPGLTYLEVTDPVVSELNNRTRFECDDEFVVKRSFVDPYWFDEGTEPDDSWEKTHG